MRRRALNVLPREEVETIEALRARVHELELATAQVPETIENLQRQVADMEDRAAKALEAHESGKRFLEKEAARLAKMAAEISEEQAKIERQTRIARDTAIQYRENSPERQTFPDDNIELGDKTILNKLLDSAYVILRDPMAGDGYKVGKCYQLIKKVRADVHNVELAQRRERDAQKRVDSQSVAG